MSTAVVTRSPAHSFSGFGGAVRSEWTKIRSVRSTYWSLAAAIIFSIGFATLTAAVTAHHYHKYVGAERSRQVAQDGFDAVSQSLTGVAIGQIAIAVLGALVISSEYRNRMIRTTLTALPRRGRMLFAKVITYGGLALVAAEFITFVSFFVAQAFYRGVGLDASLSDPGVLRAVVGTGLYMALAGVCGLGLGLIIRHSAGAITATIGFLLVLPALSQALPNPWDGRIGKLLPYSIGEQAATPHQLNDRLGAVTGLAMLAIYAAALLAIGWSLLQRRDA